MIFNEDAFCVFRDNNKEEVEVTKMYLLSRGSVTFYCIIGA